MTAKYTVVQYTPDPAAGEQINCGVITWDEKYIFSRFITDWRRIKSFAQEDIWFLREFADRLKEYTELQLPLPLAGDSLDKTSLEHIIGEWRHSIQFTQPRGALQDAKTLLSDLVPIFLRGRPAKSKSQVRTRDAASRLAYKLMRNAIDSKTASEIVKPMDVVRGHLSEHRFDVVVRNGGLPRAAVHALSFEVRESEYLRKEVEATAWSITDVHEQTAEMPLAVYMLPPLVHQPSTTYDLAVHIFKGLNAAVVEDNDRMEKWAREISVHD